MRHLCFFRIAALLLVALGAGCGLSEAGCGLEPLTEPLYPIHFQRTHTVGQRWHLHVTQHETSAINIEIDGQKATGALGAQQAKRRVELELEAEASVLELNPAGEVKRLRLQILRFDRVLGGHSSPVLQKGDVVIADGQLSQTLFSLEHRPLSSDEREALEDVVDLDQDDAFSDDKIVGTDQAQPKGGKWPVQLDLISRLFEKKGMQLKAEALRGHAMLREVSSIDGQECLVIEAKVHADELDAQKMQMRDVNIEWGQFRVDEAIWVPTDSTQPPLRATADMKLNFTVQQAVAGKTLVRHIDSEIKLEQRRRPLPPLPAMAQ